VPVVGVPFYYANSVLSQIEDRMNGDLEDEHELMMTLRHEAGTPSTMPTASMNPLRGRIPSAFDEPTTIIFDPIPVPGVRQAPLPASGVLCRRIYAQKHPDEDFAETFAVWVSPGPTGGPNTGTGAP